MSAGTSSEFVSLPVYASRFRAGTIVSNPSSRYQIITGPSGTTSGVVGGRRPGRGSS